MQRRYLSIYFLSQASLPPTDPDLKALSLVCKRYTPLVSIDAPLGILLDTTGCEALFDGERALLLQVQKDMVTLGHCVQVAIGPTPLCARAMARLRPQTIVQATELPRALYRLPIEALELDGKAQQTLRELGIRCLLELFRLPRSQLLTRFGQAVLDRIDEIRGDKKDPRVFVPEVRDWSIEEHLSDTVRDSAYLCEVVLALLERLCASLAYEGLGLQKFAMTLTHFDRSQSQIAIGVVKPSCDVKKLFRLLKLKLDRFDAGLGVERIVVRATQVKRLEQSEADTDLSSLFDTLLNRVGEKNVFSFALRESHVPEHNYTVTPAQALAVMPAQALAVMPVVMPAQAGIQIISPKLDASLRWHDSKGLRGHDNKHDNCTRPTRLFAKPEPIEVIAMLPDSPPRRIIWRRQFVFNVVKADGPERIESEWWRDNSTATRDYYRIENNKGLRLWVFKQVTAAHPMPVWYLHGLLA